MNVYVLEFLVRFAVLVALAYLAVRVIRREFPNTERARHE